MATNMTGSLVSYKVLTQRSACGWRMHLAHAAKAARLLLLSVGATLFALTATSAAASTIWNGPPITFTKKDNTDPTVATNQDPLTANVTLTRDVTMGLFNIAKEKSYNKPAGTSPLDTEWAFGTTANLTGLKFKPWVTWNGQAPSSVVGQNAVLHLITDDIYIDIKMTAWTSSGGGGFSYTRSTPSSSGPTTTPAVEYYYSAWDSYFVTSSPDEIALLDGGAYGGVWKRTGQTFNVWPQSTSTSSPTCRFFTTPYMSTTKSSHFYTPFPAECDLVKQNAYWDYESIAFYIQLAAADGTCSGGTVPLYRLYNNGMGGVPNHRYTTSLATLNQMVTAGWVFEGYASTMVFACVPS